MASGFGNKHDHSHVLLAACGRDQAAFENNEGSQGVFTEALLRFFSECEKLEEETYVSLMDHLDMPGW
jgi:hypothetical protein